LATSKQRSPGTASRKPDKAPARKAPATKKAASSKKSTSERKAPAKKTSTRTPPARPRMSKADAIRPPATRTRKPAVAKTPDPAERLHRIVVGALDDLKARDIVEVDVRGKSSVTDLLVIASGTSSRHVKSIADEVVKQAKHAGLPPIGVEGQREAEWVLVDLGDIIVHVMLPRTREFYGLERLWTVGDEAPAAMAG
jgi:ribosome-associated protein